MRLTVALVLAAIGIAACTSFEGTHVQTASLCRPANFYDLGILAEDMSSLGPEFSGPIQISSDINVMDVSCRFIVPQSDVERCVIELDVDHRNGISIRTFAGLPVGPTPVITWRHSLWVAHCDEASAHLEFIPGPLPDLMMGIVVEGMVQNRF